MVVSAAGCGDDRAAGLDTPTLDLPAHITENPRAARMTMHPDSLRRVDPTLAGFEPAAQRCCGQWAATR